MQRRAKGQRRQPLHLPHRIEMGHAGAGGGDRAQRRLAGPGRRAGDREDRQQAVADELQHLVPEGVHRPGDAVEPASRAVITAAGSVAWDTTAKLAEAPSTEISARPQATAPNPESTNTSLAVRTSSIPASLRGPAYARSQEIRHCRLGTRRCG